MEEKKNINPHLRIVKDEPPGSSKEISVNQVKDLYAHLLDTFNIISEHLEKEKNDSEDTEEQHRK